MKTIRLRLNIWLMVAAMSLAGCGASDSDDRYGATGENSSPQSSGKGSGNDDYNYMDTVSSADYGQVPEPEEEMALNAKAPQASEHYVYIAATSRDSLVRIDADTLDIRVIPVGGQPTTVATIGGEDVALVINSGTQDLSIVRSTPDDDEVTTLDTLPNVNAISVSPDGDYAIIYYDQALAAPADPVGDFQTVAVVSLTKNKEEVSFVSTGFHTSAIYFHESKPTAYLATDDGVAVIELDKVKEGGITPIIAMTEDPLEDPSLREVLVTEDGAYAVVRSLDKAQISVVELNSGDLRAVAIAGLPTDVDLIPAADRVLVILREQGLAYVADLEGIVKEKEDALTEIDISGSQAGAAVITNDGSRAVLYTTVGGVTAVALLDLNSKTYNWKSFPVQKGVIGVAVSQQGSSAVVFHEVEAYAAEASAMDKTLAESNGFTLFNLDSGYRKLIQTDHRFTEYLFVTDDEEDDLSAFVLTPDPAGFSHQLQIADLSTYLVEQIPLTAGPTSMVYVPLSRKVAVAQEHPNGRITFVDIDSGKTYSVSGYELNGLIH